MSKTITDLGLKRRRLSFVPKNAVFFLALLLPAGFLQAQTAQEAQPAQEAPPIEEQLEELNALRTEIMEINARLQAAQAEALEAEEVKEERAEYEKTLKQAMIEKKPEIAESVDRRDALLEDLLKDPDLQKPAEERGEAFQRRLQEYEEVEEKVTEVAQEVAANPEVQDSRESFQRALLLEMSRADPETPQLLQTRAEIAQRYQRLMARINGNQ